MKKIVSGLLAAAMAFTSVGLPVMDNGAHAHIETGIVAHAESYDFTYSELDNNSVMLTRYHGSDTDVIIPSEIDGHRVAALEKTFSGNKNIKSVTIPESVEWIEESTFAACSNLESVQIGENVKSIGQYAFGNCTALKEITLPQSVEYIGLRAFWNCTALTNVTVKGNVTELGEYAFESCSSLEKVGFLSNSLENIGDATFRFCENLSEISGLDNLKWVGSEAFNKTAWLAAKEQEIPLVTVGSVLLDGKNYAEADLVVPDGITMIADNAFCDNGSIKSLTVPQSVEYIADAAFFNCKNLSSISVPETLDDFGRQCFGRTAWENKQFKDSSYITLNSVLLELWSTKGDIVIPDGVVGISDKLFLDNDKITSITFPEGMKFIGRRALEHCNYINEITLPEGMEEIREYAFSGSLYLKNVYMPDSITEIGEGAFCNCPELENISIPPKVTRIKARTFCGCDKLKEFYVPENVTYIGEQALGSNSPGYGAELYLHTNVTELGKDALLYNSRIYYSGTKEEFDKISRPAADMSVMRINIKYEQHPDIVEPIGEQSCTSEGLERRTCRVCGRVVEQTAPPKAHNYSERIIIKEATCKRVGLEKRVCSECGDEYLVTYGPVHKYEWEAVTEATCEKQGKDSGVCTECGASTIRYTPKLGHDYGEYVKIPPTCTKDGYYLASCSRCNSKKRKPSNEFSIGHIRGNWVITEQPTCQTFGLKKEICTACGKTLGNYFTPRIDHDYSVRKILEEPTCTGEGSEVHACSMCGNSIDWNSIPALGHELTGATIIKKPTCTDDGIKNGICSRCNKKTNVIIPATGHKEAAEKDIQPTCTQDGLSGKKHCFVCGKILNNGTRIPKLGHAYTKWTVERHATNKHTGVRWRECTRCDYFDIDIIPMVQYDINDAWIKLSRTSYTADGKAKKPTVTIEYEYNRLKKNTDYTVKYSNNIAAGRAKVTITGKGGYKGTVVKYFKILPAKQKIKALAPLANSFAVTWTKDSGVTGYQVMYGTKSDLSDGKSVDIISNTNGKKTIKGLEAKKTYYVKVRSYKKVGNSKYYGAWSDVKKVKTK